MLKRNVSNWVNSEFYPRALYAVFWIGNSASTGDDNIMNDHETLGAYLGADDWNNAYRFCQELGWNWPNTVADEMQRRAQLEARKMQRRAQVEARKIGTSTGGHE